MSDSAPKLRVVDEEAEKAADGIVRLKPAGTSFQPIERLAPEPAAEVPARLESQPRELFEGRSQEPGLEAILDKDEIIGTAEQPWGIRDGRLAGVPYGWFVLAMVVVVGGGAWAVIQMRKGEHEVATRLAEAREMTEGDASGDRPARELLGRIERVVSDYLAADTLEKILPLVRQPERVKPLIEEEWKVRPKRAMKFALLTEFQPSTTPGGRFWKVRAETRDALPQELIVEQTGDEVRVDWETHVCHQPMDWDRYIAERSPAAAMDFRVWVTRDSVHSHEFSDAGRWRCYRLNVRGSENYLLGYAEADGEVARELDHQMESAPNERAVLIARLRFPSGGSSPRGVVIEKLVEPRWIYVTDPSKDGS